MFFMIAFSQMPTDPPTSFAALQWIVLGALTTALVYVFRQWQAEKKINTQRHLETIDKLMDALHDQLDNPDDVDINDIN
jgi:hypothetical protein